MPLFSVFLNDAWSFVSRHLIRFPGTKTMLVLGLTYRHLK